MNSVVLASEQQDICPCTQALKSKSPLGLELRAWRARKLVREGGDKFVSDLSVFRILFKTLLLSRKTPFGCAQVRMRPNMLWKIDASRLAHLPLHQARGVTVSTAKVLPPSPNLKARRSPIVIA